MSVKQCSKCGASFDCCNETRGCWCESLKLSSETLYILRQKYENCLCPECLSGFEKGQNGSVKTS